jgi:preprotein translocase subunit SecF
MSETTTDEAPRLSALTRLGNALHDGTRTVPLVSRRRTWYLISALLIVVLGSLAAVRGANLGIEFTGGSEFQISGISQVQDADQQLAREAVREHVPDNEPKITTIGNSTLRVQTAELGSDQTAQVAADLADAYGVDADQVSSSFIGPVWGGDVTGKMIRGVLVFLALVTVLMAGYFRKVTASLAAILTLLHDLLLTAAVYGVIGFEITPATIIGFLTILGYSLYDTIVVFDKVRENTVGLTDQTEHTYADLVERAANQTLMRSLNTSIVALLPVGSILVVGAFVLGAGTLKDIALALFIGIFVGTYSSVFLAPGLLVDLNARTRTVSEHTTRVERQRGEAPADPGESDLSDPPASRRART